MNTESEEVVVVWEPLPSGSGNTAGVAEKHEFKWNENMTKRLLDFYATYRKDVGTLRIKTQKHLWQFIANKLKEEYNINISVDNCHNRWRVVERNYKKFIDNKKGTGRGTKYFEYEEEMERILGKKSSVHPEILLDAQTVHVPEDVETILEENPEHSKQQEKENVKMKKPPSREKLKRQRVSVVEKMGHDRRVYYDERIQIEREKLVEIKKRNNLIEERNKILKEKTCGC